MGKDVPNIPCEIVEVSMFGGYVVPAYRWSFGLQAHPDGLGMLHISQGAPVTGEQARVVATAADMSIPCMIEAAAQLAPPIHGWLMELVASPRANALGIPPHELVRDAMKRWLLYT
jgi:hypothetical protein